MKRLRAWLILMVAATPAAADPAGDALKPGIEPRLNAVLAKTKMSQAALSYEGVPIDTTLAAVLKRFKAGKHDCTGSVTVRSCPSKEFHVRLDDAVEPDDPLDAWFVNGKLYRLEKTLLKMPPWGPANGPAYAAVFKELVAAKLGEGAVSHPAAAAVALGYPADASRPPSGVVSLELRQDGKVAIHIRWNGASAGQLDHLIARDNEGTGVIGGGGGPCDCSAVTVGSSWPQYNAHGAYRPPDPGRWTVVKVNKKACSATVVDGKGGPRAPGGVGDSPASTLPSKKGDRSEWKCSDFHPVHINPAG